MDTAARILITLTLMLFHPSAFAQQVYHCEGPGGEKTFSFAPCEAQRPTEELVVLEEPQQAPEVDEEILIEIRIAGLQDKLDALRADYNDALRQNRGKSTNDLTAEYDRKSSKVLEELMALYQQKRQVAAR